jgi:hypothetical protein
MEARLAAVFRDSRVVFERSAGPHLTAVFDTPDGTRVLR